MAEEQESETVETNKRLLVSVSVTVGALLLALLHVLLPNLEIDAITLALLILALVPWLGPIFKSIELPGGIKLEMREEMRRLKKEVTEQLEIEEQKRSDIDQRVREIEVEFLGRKIDEEEASEVEVLLKGFDKYLRGLGAQFSTFPAVNVVEESQLGYMAHYDPDKRELVVAENALMSPDVLYREYCYHAFHEPLGEDLRETIVPTVDAPYIGLAGIISGFGFYLPCSFQDAERSGLIGRLGSKSQVWASAARNGGQSHMQSLGERWAKFLWHLREHFGADVLDPCLIRAWNAVEVMPDPGSLARRFLTELTRQLDSPDLVKRATAEWDLEVEQRSDLDPWH